MKESDNMSIKVFGKKINGQEYSCLLVRNGQNIEKREWNVMIPSQAELEKALDELKAEVA